MPFLIDGNNLMFALRKAGADVGRSGVVSLLALLADAGERVTVVFDGAAPAGPLAQQVEDPRVAIVYASPQSADECIMQFIAADSAPRRLTVVSTDHELRRAARKRRCPSALSEDFAELLLRMQSQPPRPARVEPPEKRTGLQANQLEQWLKDLRLDVDETPESPKTDAARNSQSLDSGDKTDDDANLYGPGVEKLP